LCEYPIEEAFAEALDGFADARDFGDIHARADNHADIVDWQGKIRNEREVVAKKTDPRPQRLKPRRDVLSLLQR
jgi:hypothetical protein